jgi:hypothetical protein
VAPVAQRLEQKAAVGAGEIAALAVQPELRVVLYPMLQHFERRDLFPEEYLDEPSQSAARLAYWLMHPNEMDGAPAAVEPVGIVTRSLTRGACRFHVLRFRMLDGYWGAKDGWLLGLVGPFADGDQPYLGPAGAFSRLNDRDGQVTPAQLIDWYLGILKQEGAPI